MGRWAWVPSPCPLPGLSLLLLLLLLAPLRAQPQAGRVSTDPSRCDLGLPVPTLGPEAEPGPGVERARGPRC